MLDILYIIYIESVVILARWPMQGYNFLEIAELRRTFNNFDRDGNQQMSRSELARAVEQLFPWLAHTIEFRPVLTELFNKVDQDSHVIRSYC